MLNTSSKLNIKILFSILQNIKDVSLNNNYNTKTTEQIAIKFSIHIDQDLIEHIGQHLSRKHGQNRWYKLV